MATDEPVDVTTVDDRYAVKIPAPLRRRLDIEPGDSIQWSITADGTVELEPVDQTYGAFDDFEPFDLGPTDAVNDHDLGSVDYPE